MSIASTGSPTQFQQEKGRKSDKQDFSFSPFLLLALHLKRATLCVVPVLSEHA
jgi:hypothetical protein